MIRINLLPVKAAQKKEMLKGQLMVFALVMIVSVGLCAASYAYLNGEITAKQKQVDEKNAEIARLAKIIKEVKDYEKRQKDLRAKLNVLETLKNSRIGPLFLLDELYKSMPEKLWLTSYKEGNGRAQIQGFGATEETVALFMRNLESSDLYSGVELKVVKQKVQDKIEFQQFDLTSSTQSGKQAVGQKKQ